MEKIVESLNDPVYVSAAAAALSALCALLTFLFSRRLSARERVDILKAEILRVVSVVDDRQEWIGDSDSISTKLTAGVLDPDVRRLAGLLGAKYKRKKWIIFIPAAIEELRHESYGRLLGI